MRVPPKEEMTNVVISGNTLMGITMDLMKLALFMNSIISNQTETY